MFKRVVATGVGFALFASASAGCSSTPEKKVTMPEGVIDSINGDNAQKIGERDSREMQRGLSANGRITVLKGACAVNVLPNGTAVGVSDPPYIESLSAREDSWTYGYIKAVAGSSLGKVVIKPLGTDYQFHPKDSKFETFEQGNQKVLYVGDMKPKAVEVNVSSAVVSDVLQIPAMGLIDENTGNQVAITRFSKTIPNTRQEALQLCGIDTQTQPRVD